MAVGGHFGGSERHITCGPAKKQRTHCRRRGLHYKSKQFFIQLFPVYPVLIIGLDEMMKNIVKVRSNDITSLLSEKDPGKPVILCDVFINGKKINLASRICLNTSG